MDEFHGSIRGKIYHIMDMKDPDYVMLVMTTYGVLEQFEGLYKQRRYKGAGGELVTRKFNYCEVFGDHFNYRHQVDNNSNQRHYIFYLIGIGIQNIGPTGVMPTSWH